MITSPRSLVALVARWDRLSRMNIFEVPTVRRLQPRDQQIHMGFEKRARCMSAWLCGMYLAGLGTKILNSLKN